MKGSDPWRHVKVNLQIHRVLILHGLSKETPPLRPIREKYANKTRRKRLALDASPSVQAAFADMNRFLDLFPHSSHAHLRWKQGRRSCGKCQSGNGVAYTFEEVIVLVVFAHDDVGEQMKYERQVEKKGPPSILKKSSLYAPDRMQSVLLALEGFFTVKGRE